MTRKQTQKRLKPVLLMGGILTAAILSGCASTATQYSAQNMGSFTDSALRGQAAPMDVSAPLNINQVRARTLKHNSEYALAQTKLVETVRKAGARGKALLPQVYASTNGTWRSNDSASVGIKVNDKSGTMPQDFYTAQDRALAISNFTTGWDLLEIGLSGFKASRRAINAYTQGEQNQYLCNKLMVDVENAYWRAVAFEQAEKKSDWLKSRVTYALTLSQQRAEQNSETKLSELMFQRELIDINRWYQSLYRSLLSAKPELARLMNLPAGTEFDLQSTRLPANLGELGKRDALSLITEAYKNRPEIRQALYRADLTAIKNEEDLWRHLPAMRLFLGGSGNTNSFVLNQSFASAGVSLSWDLLRMGKIGETKRAGKIARAEDARQTEILAGAVMAQVMIAREQMHKLDYDLTLAWKALSVQDEITDTLNADVAAGKKPETYLVKEELMRELSFIREQMSRAELHTAKARLSQSIGVVSACNAPANQDMQTSLSGKTIAAVSEGQQTAFHGPRISD